jgi:hypothetical protein
MRSPHPYRVIYAIALSLQGHLSDRPVLQGYFWHVISKHKNSWLLGKQTK